MEVVQFDEAESYEPDDGWKRVALAGSGEFSFEWFTKPPGHSSPMHDHENEQVCIVLHGELPIHTEEETITAKQYDSTWLDSFESHKVENSGNVEAIGLDVFAPGRSFDFWTNREE